MWRSFLRQFGFEGLDPFFTVNKLGPCFTAVEEDGGDKRLVELELTCKTGVGSPDPVQIKPLLTLLRQS